MVRFSPAMLVCCFFCAIPRTRSHYVFGSNDTMNTTVQYKSRKSMILVVLVYEVDVSTFCENFGDHEAGSAATARFEPFFCTEITRGHYHGTQPPAAEGRSMSFAVQSASEPTCYEHPYICTTHKSEIYEAEAVP